MRNFVIRLLVNAFALSAAAWLIDGIQLSEAFGDILIVALIFGLLNAVLKPILMFLSFLTGPEARAAFEAQGFTVLEP